MSGIAVSPILRPIPRERSDKLWIAIGLSLLAHVVLFTILSLLPPSPPPPPVVPMDVTIADDVGLKAGAPNTTVDPAESKAPDIGNPEDSAPPAPAEEKADPAPPKPQPEAAPPPKPAPVAKPEPKKPAPPAPKAAPKALPKPAVAAPAKPAVKPGKGTGSTANAIKPKARGLNFGSDYFKGASSKPSPATGTAPKSATMSPQARTDIFSAIQRQIQPCASQHQLPPTPGLDKVRVVVTLSFARDGNPSAPPRIVRIDGLDDGNQRYADLMRRSALATFNDKSCQPIRGLPADLYDVPGGWKSVTMGFRLPG